LGQQGYEAWGRATNTFRAPVENWGGALYSGAGFPARGLADSAVWASRPGYILSANHEHPIAPVVHRFRIYRRGRYIRLHDIPQMNSWVS